VCGDKAQRIRAGDISFERTISALRAYECLTQEDISSDEDVGMRLIAHVHVAPDDILGEGLSGRLDIAMYPDGDERRRVGALTTGESRSVITTEILAQRWGIGLETAKRTLLVTTQAGVRNVLVPAERRIRKKAAWLKFPNIKGRYYTDQMFASVKDIHKHTGGSVFTNGVGHDYFYPWKSKREHPEALMSFIHENGIPQTIISDGANEIHLGKTKEICREHRIEQKVTVPYDPWQNLAEASIWEFKKSCRRVMRRTGCPKKLWSYAIQWCAAVRRITALDNAKLNGEVPETHVKGTTVDISSLALFDFYELVWFFTPTAEFPGQKKTLGYWLGQANSCVDDLAFVILPISGRPVMRKDVWAVSEDEKEQAAIKANILELELLIKEKYGDNAENLDGHGLPDIPDDILLEEELVEPMETEGIRSEADAYTPEAMDEYLRVEVLLPHGGEMARAKVIGRKKDVDGRPIGLRNANPILDTRQYEVEFPDGSTDAFTANIIAENLYSQIDNEGRSYAIIKEIIDHRTNGHAVKKDDGFTCRNGQQRPRITTAGWELLVSWADGSSDWIPLKDLKESNPVEVAEYAVANKIAEEPAFAWWVRPTLRKRDRIIKKIKTKYWKRTHKYGIRMPKSIKEALEIDAETGTTFWQDAIGKEIKNAMVAFEFRDDNVMPPGYKRIDYHMIFEIKRDLTRKARLVAGGHQTDPPKESVYSSVVSRDSVRIAFTIAALNGLDILAGDVQNAYLNAPTKEKIYTIAGPELGQDKVNRPVIVTRALYGLRSSGARWRDHMASKLRDAGFQSCLADPDVWMKPGVKPDGSTYWQYVLCYVDDVLVISHEPQKIMDYLNTRYTLKPGSVKAPDEYLGAEVRKYTIHGDEGPMKAWALSSDLYIKRAVAEVERTLAEVGDKLKTRVKTPLSTGYRPELDVTPELDAERTNYYQGLIGVLRWTVELGRVDIIVAVAMLSRYLASPRRGHLEEAFHIFAYLKAYSVSALVFDPRYPVFDEGKFTKVDWNEYYPDAKEAEPPKAPELRGNSVVTTCFVDADHAGCLVTRRSQTGIIIFLQRAPILWFSKRQNTAESSTFGSEFVTMKTAVEHIEAFRYKLRMMGIPVEGPTNVFCDNEAVFKNASKPESTLKKKHNSIAYHRTREAQAAGICRIAWESGKFNIADVLTKLLPGPRLRELIQHVLW
jgi:hypothetical protein